MSHFSYFGQNVQFKITKDGQPIEKTIPRCPLIYVLAIFMPWTALFHLSLSLRIDLFPG